VPFTIRFDGEAPAAVEARKRAEAERKRADKTAKRQAKARKQAKHVQAAQARAAELAAERQVVEDKRIRSGNYAVALASVLCVLAALAMLPTAILYFLPSAWSVFGVAAEPVRLGLWVCGGVAFFGAWLAGHVALARRSGLRITQVVGPGSLFLLMVMVPGMGLFCGPGAAFLYSGGRFPKPSKGYPDVRHPMWTTAGLGLVLAVGGLFWSVIAAHVFGMSLMTFVTSDID